MKKSYSSGKSLYIILSLIIFLLGIAVSVTIIVLKINSKSTGNKFTVTFFDANDNKFEIVKVKEGDAAKPKKQLPEVQNAVFKGWDRYINNVTNNLEVHPIYQSVTSDYNAFYIDTYYASEGEELSVNLKLGGIITVTTATIGIAYDEQVLELVTVNDSAYLSETFADKSYIKLTLDFSKQTVNPGDVIESFRFKVKGSDKITDLPIDLIDIFCEGNLANATSVAGDIYIF